LVFENIEALGIQAVSGGVDASKIAGMRVSAPELEVFSREPGQEATHPSILCGSAKRARIPLG
jgi:hypothetical protein